MRKSPPHDDETAQLNELTTGRNPKRVLSQALATTRLSRPDHIGREVIDDLFKIT